MLVMVKRLDDGTEQQRRYVPEGGTENEWKARCRKILKAREESEARYAAAMASLQAETLRADCLQAEVDGLKWHIDELESLVRDMRGFIFSKGSCGACPAHDVCEEGRPCVFPGYIERRMKDLGIEV